MAIFIEMTKAEWQEISTENGMTFGVVFDSKDGNSLSLITGDKQTKCQPMPTPWKTWSDIVELVNQLVLQYFVLKHMTTSRLTGLSRLDILEFNVYSGSYSNKIGYGKLVKDRLTIAIKNCKIDLDKIPSCQDIDRGIILKVVNDVISLQRLSGVALD